MAETGTVKWFNVNKGYGFIVPDAGGNDVFIHIKELEKTNISHLKDGQKVRYEISNNRGRQSAVNIELIEAV